jgi:HSP20 family molecular chaperone IbpA
MKLQIFVLVLLSTICNLKDQFEQIKINTKGNRGIEKDSVVPPSVDYLEIFHGFNIDSNLYPSTRVIGTNDSIIFIFELAGVEEKLISISLQERTMNTQVLKISGEKKLKSYKNNQIFQNELFEGKFERKLFLPILELETKIRNKKMENGIFEVEILRKKMKIENIQVK